MADPTYGTRQDVERNVKALFPNGFSATSVPTDEDVEEKLLAFQARVRQILHVKLGGTLPAADTDAGRVAVDAVVVGTTWWVLSVALASHPEGASLVKRWELQYQDAIRQLRELPEEVTDPATEQVRVRYDDPAARRPARFTDGQLAGTEPIW
jgi:hypothetical protein